MHFLRSLALLLGALGLLLLLAAGPGTRVGAWDYRTGLDVFRWGAYLGAAAAALALALLIVARPRTGGAVALGLALVLGLAAALVAWRWRELARRVPPIHDITTDTEDPPEFVAVLPLRTDAPNPAEYGGPEVAAQQQAAYPDVRPLLLERPPAEVFREALEEARDMEWEIVAADSAAGRIEATATTRWFGFKDDVVVRVRPEGSGTRVDVRSVSRVGRSDVGTNARRIREFLDELRD